MQKIFEILPEMGEDHATAQAKLDEYFHPKKNINYQIFQFHQQCNSLVEPLISSL